MRRFRTIPVLWLVLWMLVIPLIHVHPDTDHHGIPEHVHGGVFHTVFSQDLDGEYGHDEHDAPAIELPVLPFLGASAYLLSHPEMGFSFLSSSPDRLSAKQIYTDVLVAELGLSPLVYSGRLNHQDNFPAPILTLLANERSARAPPKTAV